MIVPVIEIVLSRLRVTAPEVPPPFKLVPAVTAVMSPVPPPPTAEPLKYKEPPTLYNLLVVVLGVCDGKPKASAVTSPVNVAFCDESNVTAKAPSAFILNVPLAPPSADKVVPPRAS